MAPFTVTLPQAGTYYILIKGAGLGDLTTGYSNYGSRGQYQVVATYPTGAAPPPPPPPAVSVLGAEPTTKLSFGAGNIPLLRSSIGAGNIP